MPPPATSASIESLYGHHHGWLRGWLRKKLGNAEQAADLAHDTFLRLLNSDGAPEALVEPRAFLTTVAQRVLANHWRRQKLERAYLEAISQAPIGLELSPEERAVLLETLIELDQLLDGLPAIIKRTFLLSQLDGLAHSEVAQALGISVSSVKRYIAKALQRCYFADLSFTG